MGFNIIIDDYFSVGDVVKLGDIEGKVIQVGLKSTKIKDINNENYYVIANRNISEALKISTILDIDIPLPYEKKLEETESVIQKIIISLSNIKEILKIEYKGIEIFGESAIFYKLRIQCNAELKPQIRRDAQRIIKNVLDENSISIPYTQLVIHTEK